MPLGSAWCGLSRPEVALQQQATSAADGHQGICSALLVCVGRGLCFVDARGRRHARAARPAKALWAPARPHPFHLSRVVLGLTRRAPGRRILISSTRKPVSYLNLAKRILQEHGEVQLSALGIAVRSMPGRDLLCLLQCGACLTRRPLGV